MGITSKMTEDTMRLSNEDMYVLQERNARLDRYVEKWIRVPEIGSGLKAMSEGKARRLAVLLENQVRHMSKLTETQYSSAFAATPENMVRLVRLAYPNSIRDRLFTDFNCRVLKA